MAYTNVQFVSGNLTTGGSSPTFYIDNVGDRVGVGIVPVSVDNSNVFQVSGGDVSVDGIVTAVEFHGSGASLTGIEGSKWALTVDGINRIGNVGIGGVASATATTKLHVYGDIDIESGSSLRIGGVIPVYSNWVVSGDNISRSLGNVGIGGVASATNTLKVTGTIEATTGFTGIQTSDVPELAAGKITSGTFHIDRIPDLAAGKITSGTFDVDRIPTLTAYAALAGSSTQAFSADTLTTTGKVGIGGAVSTTAETKLYVHGDILATGDVTASSDRRLKTDIKRIENALDKVCSLGGYTYVMNDKPSSGLIAQEVLEVLPEVVHGSEETNYSLAYGNIVGLLVEAIKELKEKIG